MAPPVPPRHSDRQRSGRQRSPGRPAVRLPFVAAIILSGVLVAACGAGKTPAEAGTGSGEQALATCMRAHGIPDFPDMKNGGGSLIAVNGRAGHVTVNGVTLQESVQQFQTAQQACQKTMSAGVGGGGPSPQVVRQAESFAACMRAHGIPNFPDPNLTAHGVQFRISKSLGITPQSAQFQAAQQACHSLLPGRGK